MKRKRKGCCLGRVAVTVGLVTAGWAGWRVYGASVVRDVITQGGRSARVLYVAGLDDGGRADSDMLLTIPVRGAITGISLPRDTEMPDHHKLCEESAHHGVKGTVLRVSRLTGTPVTGYVALRMDRLPAFVDRWLPGGVPLRVEHEIQYEDRAGHLRYHLYAGEQSLHGHDLLAYARHRKGDPRGDLGRIDRQRQVVKAVLRALAAPANLPRVPAILRDLGATGSTNLTPSELGALLVLLREDDGLRLQVAPCVPFYRGRRSLVRLKLSALRKQLKRATETGAAKR